MKAAPVMLALEKRLGAKQTLVLCRQPEKS
jgi:hypothetical protein